MDDYPAGVPGRVDSRIVIHDPGRSLPHQYGLAIVAVSRPKVVNGTIC
jgi:hypothetical protein